ncbi:hypothetical protein SISNIDRAFT_485872 [Sistotremastrum niveocremeum HHB9708]|uniref:Uncharacterized protein n=1 Tax=Sistotremastrum niveocremeum HHB9708 TaxID=1314777 RepID=A0A164U4U8_9AGAM|nr:hypothetical protein SISNIDRAFT_485872 [Sistotremastrum niveocremeum HHB9708]
MPSLDAANGPKHGTPHSFFSHSPPPSPVASPTTSRFSQFSETLASLTGRTRPSSRHSVQNSDALVTKARRQSRDEIRREHSPQYSDTWRLDSDPFAPSFKPVDVQPNGDAESSWTSVTWNPDVRRRRTRVSLLSTAADSILSRTRSRNKNRPGPPRSSQDVSRDDILDISRSGLTLSEEEERERERLREAAAQSIGLTAASSSEDLVIPTPSQDGFMEPREPKFSDGGGTLRSSNGFLSAETLDHVSQFHRTNGQREFPVQDQTAHAPSKPLPNYPTSFRAISGRKINRSSVLPKYYPSNSTLSQLLGRSRNWKLRYICLSSPTADSPGPSYLHVFKNSTPDPGDLEVNRMEINDDSVVFVADEDVGGRSSTLRVGGHDLSDAGVGKDRNPKPSPQHVPGAPGKVHLWVLHIVDPKEMQGWIADVKTAILRQRTQAAGMTFVSPDILGNDSRGPGDIDLALTIRAHKHSSAQYISSHVPIDKPEHAIKGASTSEFFIQSSASALKADDKTSKGRSPSPRSVRGPTPEVVNGSHLTLAQTQDIPRARRSNVLSFFRSGSTSASAVPSLHLSPPRTPISIVASPTPQWAVAQPTAEFLQRPLISEEERERIDSEVRAQVENDANGNFGGISTESDRQEPSQALLSVTETMLSSEHPNVDVDFLDDNREDAKDLNSNLGASAPQDRPHSFESSHSTAKSDKDHGRDVEHSNSGLRRFSGALPKMLAPPTGPPPGPPESAADNDNQDLNYSRKITSSASSSGIPGHGGRQTGFALVRFGTKSRSSAPPPPRPPPEAALPPTPISHPPSEPASNEAPSKKPAPVLSSFRHRRSGSTGNAPSRKKTFSPPPPILAPPLGPLPPTPEAAPANRVSSFKERLRMNSDPSSRPSSYQHPPSRMMHPFGMPLSATDGGFLSDPFLYSPVLHERPLEDDTDLSFPRSLPQRIQQPQSPGPEVVSPDPSPASSEPMPLSPPPRRSRRSIGVSRDPDRIGSTTADNYF